MNFVGTHPLSFISIVLSFRLLRYLSSPLIHLTQGGKNAVFTLCYSVVYMALRERSLKCISFDACMNIRLLRRVCVRVILCARE